MYQITIAYIMVGVMIIFIHQQVYRQTKYNESIKYKLKHKGLN